MIEFIQQQLENQFLSGGVVLIIFGSILALSRQIPNKLYRFLHRRLVTTLDVSDQDQAFYWLQRWLAEHEYTKTARLLTLSTRTDTFGNDNKPSIVEVVGEEETGSDKPIILFSPAPGLHLLKFEGHWILLGRNRQEQSAGNSFQYWRESFILKTFVKDRNYLRRLIYEARDKAFPKDNKRLTIWSQNYGNWRIISSRLPRESNSVILRNKEMENIEKDVDLFLNSSQWYKERGIPYQRGYLLYGAPGNGKTSLVVALASKFNLSLRLASLLGFSDFDFIGSMSQVPHKSIILIEDVDRLFEIRKVSGNSNKAREDVTFSGFLNSIDGVVGSDGRIIIFTTNHIEKLDPVLIRPGRIDYRLKFENATKDQAQRLYSQFFKTSKSLSEEFSYSIEEGKYNMAQLQNHLLTYRNSPESAARNPVHVDRIIKKCPITLVS